MLLKYGGGFDSDAVYKKIAEKEAQSGSPGFWNDVRAAEKVMAEIKALKNRVEPWAALLHQVEDLYAFFELADEEGGELYTPEVNTQYAAAAAEFERLSILNLLSDEVDQNDAYLTVHAGAGGTEACDWAQMLTRMYTRWAEKHKFSYSTLELSEVDEGLKSITLLVRGHNAYGFLKGETGIHRLVRISPFDSNGRRHTSFGSVYAFPVLDDTVEVDIKSEDIRIDTYRASGAGGQHVNKTDSAVRITHLPTGIVVACQNERSQTSNKHTAMGILKAQLYEYYREQKEKENMKFAKEKKGISWGNQIRSYVFQPYTMVKDHRTKYETGNIQAVMDGGLDGFIENFLKKRWENLPIDSEGPA